jgi:hypothetical protein
LELEAAMKKLWKIIAAATAASISVDVSAATAENLQKLSGVQIRAKLTGMQLTDEVHWRCVYDRDGTLRSYSMGTRRELANGRSRRTNSVFISRNRTIAVSKYRSRANASR